MSRGWERLEKERSEGGRKSCEVWVFFWWRALRQTESRPGIEGQKGRRDFM